MNLDDELDRAIGDWLLRKEAEPELLPGTFAAGLAPGLREPFLRELEALAAIDGLTTQAPPRDLPRRYGDFRVLGELGRGAMGVVYDAEQVSTGKRVALKVMHAHVANDLHSASRFQREARTAAALVHPGIVPVLGFGETDGAAWLAMERVAGHSLQRLLAAHADARDVDHAAAAALLDDPKQLARTLADAADALEFAHRHGVVHRDIKPANLMCTADGRTVVLDFGLAKGRDTEAVTLTRDGDFLGTPLYMAPEQAIGAENGSAQSDVYALGAVLYECLCGRPPVAPGPLAAVIDAILHRDAVDPRRVRDGVPEELARIAMQCLDKDPGRRYPAAAALADDLRRHVDGSGVLARNSGIVSRSWRRLRRRPAVASLLAAVLVGAIGLAFTLRSASDAGTRADAAQQQRDVLQHARDVQRIDELLGGAPERVTVFGGASLRFYARIGLGEQIDDGTRDRSAAAAEALGLATALVAAHGGDIAVLRAAARARLDVGDDAAASDAAVAALLAHPAATAADRMMAAVHARQRGREEEATRLHALVEAGDEDRRTRAALAMLPHAPDEAETAQAAEDSAVAYWLAFWHQDEQDHEAAIAAFTRALDRGGLTSEARYQALLHRGWCRTCPDVARLRQAQDDLLQAAALRPNYGTPMLLWAALRCLEARVPADLAEPVEAVGKVLKNAEPWVHVLTARVLLALAEGGIAQAGPIAFGSELSPIAVVPVPAAIADALAGTALALLDGVLAKGTSFEAGFHRVAALALTGRHGDALAAADALQANAPRGLHAVVELQRARVHLAAGSLVRAQAALRRSLEADHRSIAAWRLRASIAAHLGDAQGRLEALERTARLLVERRLDISVFPDAAAQLPEVQIARAGVLADLGRRGEALELLRSGAFGGALAGEFSPRVRLQRDALLRRLGGEPLSGVAPVPADSPLRWLDPAASASAPADAEDAGAALAAMHRGWLDATSLAPALARDACIAEQRGWRGLQPPADLAAAPLQTLFANAPALARDPALARAVLQRAEAELARDPEATEPRVLQALVLFLTDQEAAAADVLVTTLATVPDDLRVRYLLALAARRLGDRELLRTALRRGRTLLEAPQIDAAAGAVPVPERVAGALLLGELR